MSLEQMLHRLHAQAGINDRHCILRKTVAIFGASGKQPMSGKAAKFENGWDFSDRYDWQSWVTWRAFLATAAIFGLMGAAAAVIAEAIVRYVLGMPPSRTLLGGPELLVIAVAAGITLPFLLIWVRVQYYSDDGEVDRSAAQYKQAGVTQRPSTWFVPLGWIFCVMVVTFVFYHAWTSLIGSAQFSRLPAWIFLQPMLVAHGSSLHMGLRRFGATTLPSGPAVQ